MVTPHTFVVSATCRRHVAVLLLAAAALTAAAPALAQSRRARLSADLAERLRRGDPDDSRVIVSGTEARIEAIAARHGLRIRKWLHGGAVLDVPSGFLERLANDADVDALSEDLVIHAHMAVTNVAIGADQVHEGTWARGARALTGKGIGVAVIDSGVASVPALRGRIIASRDFTGTPGTGDRYGHGTHIAGIIAATLRTPGGVEGVAPEAHIISLRVLDEQGAGRASDVIEAIDWAVANQQRFNIRVLNLSLGGAVTQSWRDDPLCQAVERAYRAGLVVVASAGNLGKLADGTPVYGGITSPGNSPYALTVGAVNTKATPWRSDDEIASYSSRGPTRFDHLIKPDLVAPGHRIHSLVAPGSTLATEHPEIVIGSGPDAEMVLSGTSMAAAVVSGAAAVLIEERRYATPLHARQILQFTSTIVPDSTLLETGTGSLSIVSACAAASSLHAITLTVVDEPLLSSGLAFGARALLASANNDRHTARSENVLWGNANNVLWGNVDNVLWGNANNVLWGNADNVLWGNADNVLWGNADNVLWSNADNVLWGNTDNLLREN